MFGSIAIPIWTKSGGGVETISEPGRYVLYVIVTVPQSLIGKSLTIPGTDWTVTVADIKAWERGSKVYVDVGNVRAGVTEAKLSPLQLNLLLGAALFVAFAFLVDRIAKVSPFLTVLVYGVVILALVVVYVRYIHPRLRKK